MHVLAHAHRDDWRQQQAEGNEKKNSSKMPICGVVRLYIISKRQKFYGVREHVRGLYATLWIFLTDIRSTCSATAINVHLLLCVCGCELWIEWFVTIFHL